MGYGDSAAVTRDGTDRRVPDGWSQCISVFELVELVRRRDKADDNIGTGGLKTGDQQGSIDHDVVITSERTDAERTADSQSDRIRTWNGIRMNEAAGDRVRA